MLDALYESYSETLNTRLDDTNALISDVISEVNANASTISGTLNASATSVGTTLSEEMSNIWSNEGGTNSIIAEYGKGFQSQQTTTNLVLGNIKSDVSKMVSDTDKDAKTNVNSNDTKSSSSATNDYNKTTTTNTQKTAPTTKRTLDSDTLMSIAAAIWVHGSDAGWGNNPTRENKLTNKLGSVNAKRVQKFINDYGESGRLYSFWVTNNKQLKDYKYNAFASGSKLINEDQLAWTQEKGQEFIIRPSDGAILTPIAKGDSVLNAQASGNIWNMANNPAEFIKDSLKLDVANVPNGSSISNSTVQHFENITFSMPNVKNYGELLSELQKDPKFDKLVKSMTIDRISGGSSLAKGKSIR